ncbi:MAG: CvpA family protein [Dehalococcoidia bacterium]|nr:CvpA family protein [Dehalococcoidia bacterium]
MNWLDIVIIIVLIVLGVAGLRQGMVRTVFGIAGLIGGIFLAGRYYDELAARLFPSGAIWGNIAAYAIIVIATLVVAGLIGWLLAKLVNFAALGWLDKFMGFILGVVIGGLLFAAILAIVLHFADYYPGMEATINQSAIGRFLVTAFPLRY